MKRALRILLYIAGSLTVLLLAAMLGLQIYFDSDRGAKLVQDLAGKYMDARLDFSRLTLSTMKRFPSIMLDADSISITYPHSRFDSCGSAAVSSRLLNAGRGEEADTLLSLNSLHLKVNPWHLPARRLRVLYADFEGIRLFAHEYDSTHANWKILPPSKESDGESFIRWISLGHLGISGRNTFVYTAAQNTVFAGAMLKSLELGGGMR
ncbi:MAG: hypothetical protein J5764_04860, partial [Bacteroidales bacterium]|nr:hypothetical protein [Bacteroidales bacterium]